MQQNPRGNLRSAPAQPAPDGSPLRQGLSTLGRWLDTLSSRVKGGRSSGPSRTGTEVAAWRTSTPVPRSAPHPPAPAPQALSFSSAEKAEATREAALAVLNNVLHILPRNRVPLPALSACQQDARNLSYILTRRSWSELPTVTRDLAMGRHPYADLLILAERGDELSDEQWAVLTKKVSAAFERPLAFAAARGKLTFVGQRAAAPSFGTRDSETEAAAFVFQNIVVP